MSYPFELEWLEGDMLYRVQRILTGQSIYVEPTFEFVPTSYTPFYFYLSALFCQITQPSFTTLRLISFISSLGSFFLIFKFINKETGNLFSSFIAMALFAATFSLSGTWFDLARVDSLFLFLLLSSIYILRFHHSILASITAGLLLALSFFTKQTAIFIFILLATYYLFISNQKEKKFFIISFLTFVALSTMAFNLITDGWYHFFTFVVQKDLPIHKDMIFGFWKKDILKDLPLVFVLSACSLLIIFKHLLKDKKADLLFYLFLFIGMFGSSWYHRIRDSYVNSLFPAHAVMCLLSGLAIYEVLSFLTKKISSFGLSKAIENAFYFLLISQFILLLYNPFQQLPTKEDLKTGKKVIASIKNIEGNILIPDHGYLAALAGKKFYSLGFAMTDVLRCHDDKVKNNLFENISRAVSEKKFSAIILDHYGWPFDHELNKNYNYHEALPIKDSIFYPIAGAHRRPEYIYKRLPISNN